MHEYAITESIIDIVSEEAKNAGAGRISKIKLVIGELSTIMDESVEMYFDIISRGTIAEGAKLVFTRVAAEFECRACKIRYNKKNNGFFCPVCGDMGTPTDIGKEFYIESIEIE